MKKWTKQFIVLFTFMVIVFTGLNASAQFTTKDLNEESILALAWVQNSAEYKALALQAFNMATLQWDMDKKGFFKSFKKEKRCVVVDVDEAVVDNSAYQSGLIGKDFGYGSKTWKEWCDAAEATAIPGAVDFCNHVVKTGGDVFYITNRKAMPDKNMDLTEGTMKNLKALGFPQVDKKHLMLRTASSKKQPRRDSITEMGYRIVLLVGDNLADFAEAFDGETMEARDKAVEMNKKNFGFTFIVLPNPMYGNWEAAVYGGGKWYKKSAKEKSDIRIKTLRKFKFSE